MPGSCRPNRRSKLGKYISHIKLTQPENAAGWPVEFTAFKYVASFKDHFQLRTYWYNGGNYHLLGDRADLISESNNFEEWSWLRSKGGTIDDAALPLDKIRALGTATLKAIRDSAPRDERLPAEFEHVPAARVDFGCCLDRSDPKFAIADGWFINEVEPLACTATSTLFWTISHDFILSYFIFQPCPALHRLRTRRVACDTLRPW